MIALDFDDLPEPLQVTYLFIGGSLDGKEKEATVKKKITERFVMTLKNQEQYRFEKPNIMRFIGTKPESVVVTREKKGFWQWVKGLL